MYDQKIGWFIYTNDWKHGTSTKMCILNLKCTIIMRRGLLFYLYFNKLAFPEHIMLIQEKDALCHPNVTNTVGFGLSLHTDTHN